MSPVPGSRWILLVTAGCAATAPTTSTGSAANPSTTVPWVLPDTHVPAELPVDGVERAIQDAVARAGSLDPSPVFDAYRALAAGADAACPAVYDSYGIAYWLDTCTAASGTSFDGYGVDDVQSAFDGVATVDVTTVGGVGRITADDGSFVDVDGYVQLSTTDDGTVTTTSVLAAGTFATDLPLVDGTWVADGIVPNLFVTRYVLAGLGNAAIVTGTLEGLPGAYPTVAFDEAVLVAPETGISDCGLEPAGSISVLGEDGVWVDVVFDPVLGTETVSTDDPKSCDGCGQAWVGPDAIGTACFSFAAWL